MERRIPLVLVPSLAALYDERYARYSPPSLALGVLQACLRRRGHTVVSTDLNAHIGDANELLVSGVWEVLYDKRRVLAYLAGGADAAVDALVDRLFDLRAVAASEIVGISTGSNMSFFEIHLALLLSRRIRFETGHPVVLGGANLGYLWQFREEFQELWSTLLGEGIYVFLGPGERSFVELSSCEKTSDWTRLYRTLPGAVFWERGTLTRNPYAAPAIVRPDFAGLPLEHYALCCDTRPPADASQYLNLVHYYKWPYARAVQVSEANRKLPAGCRQERLFIPYVFNHNCPFRCAFCVQSRADKPPAMDIDARAVVDDLEALGREHRTPYFHFYDNAFNCSTSFVADFCRVVEQRGVEIYWSDCARFNNLDARTIDALYRSGCRRLVFGLDSASEKICRLIHKGINLEQASRVLEMCRDRGIWSEVEVIVGLPFEGEEEFRATHDFVTAHLGNGSLNDFHVNRYFVIPESLLGSQPATYGIAIERTADGYDRALAHECERLANVRAAVRREAGSTMSMRRELLWKYREIGGRDADHIEQETEDKFRRMLALKSAVT